MLRVRTLLEALPLAAAWSRHGRPEHVFTFEGGIGDDLLSTALIHELRGRGGGPIWMLTEHPELFRHNPDVTLAIRKQRRGVRRFLELAKLQPQSLTYTRRREGRDFPPGKHVITTLCENLGITGRVTKRPYLFLRREERAAGRLGSRQIAVQSSGRAARFAARTKEWYPERLQQLVDRYRADYSFVQVGSASDPLLRGALDRRGKTGLRETAAILHHSLVFVGLAGLVQHLARSVGCRSVIVYGGRELPSQTGYTCDENVVSNPACSPCWIYDGCEHGMKCMDAIGVDEVARALQRQLARQDQPLTEDSEECASVVPLAPNLAAASLIR